MERALGTPVQTAVKREDEGGRTNGSKLLFWRRCRMMHLSRADRRGGLRGLPFRVEQRESLHATDAVAYASKGIARDA